MDSPSSRVPLRRTADQRWSLFFRTLAAVVGGYVLTSLMIVAFSLAWPGHRARGVLGVSMLGFLIYAGIVMWAFTVRTARRVWWTLLLASVALGILITLLKLQKAT